MYLWKDWLRASYLCLMRLYQKLCSEKKIIITKEKKKKKLKTNEVMDIENVTKNHIPPIDELPSNVLKSPNCIEINVDNNLHKNCSSQVNHQSLSSIK